jgi:hypothetical protein
LPALLAGCLWPVPNAVAQEPDPEPFGAEDHAAEDDPVHIPEPMIFDLVRGLGAQQGELEAVKLAAQATLGTAFESRFVHGTSSSPSSCVTTGSGS